MMKKERRLRQFQGGRIEVMATVIEPLPTPCFEWNWRTSIKCWRTFPARCAKFIRILAGDKVAVELSPYDLTRGRIVYRYK